MLTIGKNVLCARYCSLIVPSLCALRATSFRSEPHRRHIFASHNNWTNAQTNPAKCPPASQVTGTDPPESVCDINRFTYRSHSCGQLDRSLVGSQVTLCGWVEFQRLGKFVVLSDCYGSVQIFVKSKELQDQVKKLNLESVIQVKGKVNLRPEKDINPKMINGDIEIAIEDLTVLNNTKAELPFLTREYMNINEKLRLEYRYLDLRRPKVAHNLRMRSNFIMSLRNCLVAQYGFVDVETPTLFKATPGGAQEFIVPTRFANQFYSLVQSPQQFKQLLMIGGIDRYFQIARCYRDEGTKSDRQPEFTQLDIEMSFTTKEHVMDLVEQLLLNCWPIKSEITQLSTPFSRMDYHTAMDKYGVDKPDLRSPIEIKQLHNIDSCPDLEYYVLVIPQEYDTSFSIKSFIENDLQTQVNTLFFKGQLNHFKWSAAPFQQNLPKDAIDQLSRDFNPKDNDFIWIASGTKANCMRLLGRIRACCIDAIEDERVSAGHTRKLSLLWLDKFPLFLANEETGKLESSHHPFTAPEAAHTDLVYTEPSKVIGQNFDLVINGREIGGGSIRIVDHQLQRYILKNILECDSTSMEYFMEALNSGCPPHGGFAIGLDRLMALICCEASIRDVIAFPKSAHGKDLMAQSPGPIDSQVRKMYHIDS